MADGTETATVRVRGIYATALTERFRRVPELTVVDPSPTIADRFEDEFETDPAEVTVDMTSDRMGLSVTGTERGITPSIEAISDIGVDTFSWEDPTPTGAIIDGTVERSEGRGLIVSLDEFEGYLPGKATERAFQPGDSLHVQVRESEPPWTDSRPALDTTIQLFGTLANLVRGVDATVADTPPGTEGEELARTTELLSPDLPDGWAVSWKYTAIDADLSTMETELSMLVKRAKAIETKLDSEPSSERDQILATPRQTVWVRFGRATRFALDDLRQDVTATVPGHHRIKAGSESAGTAVDFLEAVGQSLDTFPFGPVTATFGPTEGDAVRIVHTKPDGDEFDLGRGTVTDRTATKGRVTVERSITSSGTYDALGTERSNGDTATTRFQEGRWWYPTVYRGESGNSKGTYVNIATPVEVFPDAIRYVDLYVDVIKRPDGTVEIVDESELGTATEAGHVPEAVADRATDTASRVASVLRD